ncbi:MAG TPA: maleylacetoacetate isomerase [Casimicrobiaceae bacterium]|jgi:maleylacetoacetate isomerase|nr:maleylacetoacetate isomerase [Casimicrobiaceae bacterium]HWD17554.1 maleylacetoacetate isomerase [Casimicrobiaceae bacterium]
MRLYDYFRSSAAYRVRIALNLKGVVPDERTFVHLRMGNQRAQDYLALNPQGLVPALALDDGTVLTQSLAIVEFLDETHPQPPLLPADAEGRARVRSIALAIACEIHPLNNLRVLNYLVGTLGVSREQKDGWYRYWIDVGFEALEKSLSRDPSTGRFCHGDAPTLADVCLVPQLANARRFSIDLSPYPTLVRIESECNALPAFASAAPARQPDAE